MALLSLLLGHLSWRWVEAPWRDRRRWSRRTVFQAAAAGTLLFILVGLAFVRLQGLPQRWSPAMQALVEPPKTRIEGCPAADAWLRVCPLGHAGAPVELVLLGDSHAYALGTALDERLTHDGRAGALVHTDCHPIPGLFDSRESNTPQRQAYCAEANRRLLDFVGSPTVQAVLVGVRWAARLSPMGDQLNSASFDNGEGGVERDLPHRKNLALDAQGQLTAAAEPKTQALRSYLQQLSNRKPTVVLDPVPEVGWTPSRLNLLSHLKHGEPPASISTALSAYTHRQRPVLDLLASVNNPRLQRSQPQTLLCDTQLPGRCIVQDEARLYYADDDHLSMLGAQLIVDDMLAKAAAMR